MLHQSGMEIRNGAPLLAGTSTGWTMAAFHSRLRPRSLCIRGPSTTLMVSILALLAIAHHGSGGGDIAGAAGSQAHGTGSLARDEDGWAGFPTRLEVPVTYTGTRIGDYEWDYVPSALGRNRIWVAAKAGAARDPGGYVALGWTFAGEPLWGTRVRLQAVVSVRDVGDSAYAALFVRVANERTRHTLVFDNMRSRVIQGVNQVYGRVYAVVVNVPSAPPLAGDSCPAEDAVPDAVQAGFVVCGGRGRVDVVDAKFGVVQSWVPVTGGEPPWIGPPDIL